MEEEELGWTEEQEETCFRIFLINLLGQGLTLDQQKALISKLGREVTKLSKDLYNNFLEGMTIAEQRVASMIADAPKGRFTESEIGLMVQAAEASGNCTPESRTFEKGTLDFLINHYEDEVLPALLATGVEVRPEPYTYFDFQEALELIRAKIKYQNLSKEVVVGKDPEDSFWENL